LGDLVLDNPDVLEIEFNPLYASAERIAALDVRVRLHDPAIPASELPKPAVRPYPVKYVDRWIAPDGARVLFRPIRAQDEPAVREFQRSLSDTTVYQRYAHFVALDGRIAHARLARSCFIDYGREIALVAESDDSQRRMLGIGNLVKSHAWGRAEFALLVADQAQGRGIGTEMLRRLIGVGRDEGVTEIVGYVLPSNIAMLGICARLGFEKRGDLEDGIIQTVLRLK
jgi:acetyltransferase